MCSYPQGPHRKLHFEVLNPVFQFSLYIPFHPGWKDAPICSKCDCLGTRVSHNLSVPGEHLSPSVMQILNFRNTQRIPTGRAKPKLDEERRPCSIALWLFLPICHTRGATRHQNASIKAESVTATPAKNMQVPRFEMSKSVVREVVSYVLISPWLTEAEGESAYCP